MYDELVKSLRICAEGERCDKCGKWEVKQNGGRNACEYAICTEAADAIEELSTVVRVQKAVLEKFPRWIPVTERLPEDLQNVLVLDDGRVTIGHCEHYYGDEQIYVEWHDTLYYPIDPPCWMPLPEPPKEGE